jgi:hypothetical protein
MSMLAALEQREVVDTWWRNLIADGLWWASLEVYPNHKPETRVRIALARYRGEMPTLPLAPGQPTVELVPEVLVNASTEAEAKRLAHEVWTRLV